MANPTNRDIIAEIQEFRGETNHRLKSVEEQVRATNGRVLKLEQDKIVRDAVSEERKNNQTIGKTDNVNTWDRKQISTALVTFLMALAALVGVLTNKIGG